MKPLIAGRATAKEIDLARCYIAKDSSADDNIGSYCNVGIGRGNAELICLKFLTFKIIINLKTKVLVWM